METVEIEFLLHLLWNYHQLEKSVSVFYLFLPQLIPDELFISSLWELRVEGYKSFLR